MPGLERTLLVSRRWDPTLQIDWNQVRRVFYSFWSPGKRVRFDKSPPHILRATQLEAQFARSRFLVTIRNPYACVEGYLRRNWPFEKFGPQPFGNAVTGERVTPAVAAEFWVKPARAQMRNLQAMQSTLFST